MQPNRWTGSVRRLRLGRDDAPPPSTSFPSAGATAWLRRRSTRPSSSAMVVDTVLTPDRILASLERAPRVRLDLAREARRRRGLPPRSSAQGRRQPRSHAAPPATLARPRLHAGPARHAPGGHAIHEAMRLARDLPRADIAPFAWIISQSLTPLVVTDPVRRSRRAHQQRHLREIIDQAARTVPEPWTDEQDAGVADAARARPQRPFVTHATRRGPVPDLVAGRTSRYNES